MRNRSGLNDKRRNLDVPIGHFAQRVQDRMLELSEQNPNEDVWDVRRLTEELSMSYEYLRKVVSGEVLPSPTVVNFLAQLLDIPVHELKTLYTADEIRKKYGTIPMEICGKLPELEPIERKWSYLSDEHRQHILRLVDEYAKRDRLAVVG